MPFIYKIINDINNKIYVGKTVTSIGERWSKHIFDATNHNDKSLIHYVMKKYGIEHFKIEKIEECDYSILDSREVYWIKYFNAYEDGYNMSLGGEGNLKYDYEEIYKLFKQGFNQLEIAAQLHCEKHTVTRALRALNVPNNEINKNKFGNARKKVYQIEVDTDKILKEFNSLTEVAKYEKLSVSMISQICNGKRKLKNKNYTYKKEKNYETSRK